MKRLLLIIMFPMQVFAGMLTYKTITDSAVLELQVQQEQRSQQLLAEAAAPQSQDQAEAAAADPQVPPDQADRDDDNYSDIEDFSNHAGVGDETVLNPATIFPVDSATLASTLHSDEAVQSPYLPPAVRPPRI